MCLLPVISVQFAIGTDWISNNAKITGVKLMIVTIVTTIPRWRREKPVRSILLIISLCVLYLRMVCW